MANLTYVAPFFIVKSLKASVAFYTDKLGFEVRFISPDDDPFFAIVARDNVSIMLKGNVETAKPNHIHEAWARWDAYISANDPDSLFDEYQSKDVTFHQSLKDDDDGLRGFEVIDADGYILFFGRPK